MRRIVGKSCQGVYAGCYFLVHFCCSHFWVKKFSWAAAPKSEESGPAQGPGRDSPEMTRVGFFKTNTVCLYTGSNRFNRFEQVQERTSNFLLSSVHFRDFRDHLAPCLQAYSSATGLFGCGSTLLPLGLFRFWRQKSNQTVFFY